MSAPAFFQDPTGAGLDHDRSRFPRVPQTLEDIGLSEGAIFDLVLKTLYIGGSRAGHQISESVALPFHFVDNQLLDLQQRRLVEVRGAAGHSRAGYMFDLTQAGRERAREALETNMYVGPAPVPLEQYRATIRAQTIRRVRVNHEQMEHAFRQVVLHPTMLDLIGPAINSGRSLFLYGEAGNGKTLIAETISGLLGGAMFVPYAVDVGGLVMTVYDPVYHRPIPVPEPADRQESDLLRFDTGYDRRYVRVARPVVMTGGELSLEDLDLKYDTYTKLYQAPFQVKANGGVLIVDDFGRQRVPPRDLLNRWIVPLEKHVDFLTLHTGGTFPVPFDCLLIIATNISPTELVEEAFLRRIRYKVYVDSPSRERYEDLFQRCCAERGIRYVPAAVNWVYRNYYERLSIAPRSCHPRDLTDHLLDVAAFLETQPVLTPELLDRACRSYFLDVESVATAEEILP
jgi:predicted ATPase with chaperone activity